MSWTPFLWLVSVYFTYLSLYNKAPFGASKQMSFCVWILTAFKAFWPFPSQFKPGFGNSILRRISMVNAVIASWLPKKESYRWDDTTPPHVKPAGPSKALSSSSEEPLVLQAPPVPSTTTVQPCPWRRRGPTRGGQVFFLYGQQGSFREDIFYIFWVGNALVF